MKTFAEYFKEGFEEDYDAEYCRNKIDTVMKFMSREISAQRPEEAAKGLWSLSKYMEQIDTLMPRITILESMINRVEGMKRNTALMEAGFKELREDWERVKSDHLLKLGS